MATLHLFNPENDLALAADEPHYTPPSRAKALAVAGELLPAWWAARGDMLIAPNSSPRSLDALKERFGLEGEIFTGSPDNVNRCSPWGWSRYAVTLFEAYGITPSIMPSPERINHYRELSGRSTAALINQQIAQRLPDVPMPSRALVTTSVDEAMNFVDLCGKECYVKAPWSSSGRGVFCLRAMSAVTIEKQIGGIVRHQGYVTIERALDRVVDFAALYRCENGRVDFMGWSLFATHQRCAYLGNYIAPQAVLKQMIVNKISGCNLDVVMEAQREAICRVIAPGYDGVLGVDMMVYRDQSGRNMVAPCIEVNLRHTMGMAAMAIQQKLGFTGVGIFSIVPEREANGKEEGGIDILPPSQGFCFRMSLTDDIND